MKSSNLPNFEPKASSERLHFGSSTLADFPFQFIPGVVYPSEVREKSLAWQTGQALSFSSQPLITIIVHSSDPDILHHQLESLAVQSWRNFRVMLLVEYDPEKVVIEDEHNFVSEIHQLKNFGSKSWLSTISDLCSSSSFRHLLFLGSDAIFHPEALFVLAKEIVKTSPGAVYFNETISGLQGENLSYLRKTAMGKYSFLTKNWFGQSFYISGPLFEAALAELLRSEGKDSLSSAKAMNWFSASYAVCNTDVSFLPFALVARVRGQSLEDQCPHSDLDFLASWFASRNGLELEGLRVSDKGEIIPEPRKTIGSVQVIIPFKDQSIKTAKALQSLANQAGRENLQILLVDNNSKSEELASVQTAIRENGLGNQATIITDRGHFNYARLNNVAASRSDSDFILLMNNDVELEGEGDIERLKAVCSFPDVGCVGAWLKYPDGRTQHSGINFAGVRPLNVTEESMFSNVFREVNGVSFALAMIRRDSWKSLNGLDETSCPNGFGDALFCHQLSSIGQRVILDPGVSAIHHESVSRGVSVEDQELFDMSRNGLQVADQFEQLEAKLQPVIISGLVESAPTPAFDAVVRKLKRKPALASSIEVVAQIAVKSFKAVKTIRRSRERKS